MKIFSLHDLRPGDDKREFFPVDSSSGEDTSPFAGTNVRFFGRDEETAPATVESGELMLIVMQGRCRVLVNEVQHPVRTFDVVLLQAGDTWSVCADDVDPAVIFTVAAGQSPA